MIGPPTGDLHPVYNAPMLGAPKPCTGRRYRAARDGPVGSDNEGPRGARSRAARGAERDLRLRIGMMPMDKAILALAVCAPIWVEALDLVRDGKPLAEIVISDAADPSVKAAAAELSKYVRKMSGAELRIVTAPTGKTPVYVGRSGHTDKRGIRLDDVKDDGFWRIVTDDYAALVGIDRCRPPIPRCNVRVSDGRRVEEWWQEYTGHRWWFPRTTVRDPRNFCFTLGFHQQDANGTLYAVYDFLETLGMRWFMPIERLGEVVPESRDISVAPVQVKKEPAFAVRCVFMCGTGKNPTEFLWYKYLKLGGVFDPWPAHSASFVSKLQQDRPELFAHVNGEVTSCGNGGWLPRLASPELRRELAEYLVRAHDAFPEIPYLPIGQPDGWGDRLDDRDVAAGWDREELGRDGRFSDYMWDFAIDVAAQVRRERPDTKFFTMSYSCTREPPRDVDEIPGDIGILLAQRCEIPGRFQEDLARRRRWLQRAPSSDLFLYDYYLAHYPGKGRAVVPVPAIFTTNMAESFRELPDRCRVSFAEMSWSKSRAHGLLLGLPGINHLTLYLHGKFCWDRDLDLEATLEDYYDKFFGPAKDEMREFYEFAGEVWMRPGPRQITASSGFLKSEDVPEYFRILDRARVKAGDTVYGERIDFIANEMEPLKRLFTELKRTGPYVRLRVMDEIPRIDGDLAKPFWTYPADKVALRDCVTGAAGLNWADPRVPRIGTTAAFRWLPDNSLLVGVACYEDRMGHLKALTPASQRDRDSIWSDDNVEIHLETPDGYRAVVAVNPNGAVHDRCVTPDAAAVPVTWRAGEVAARRLPDRWTAEIRIEGLGDMPNRSYPWGVNVFRQRLTGESIELQALSPTGNESFLNAESKMGNLYGP